MSKAWKQNLPDAWWKNSNSSQLGVIIDHAIHANHNGRIAIANVKTVRALRRLTKFDLAPTVQADASRGKADDVT